MRHKGKCNMNGKCFLFAFILILLNIFHICIEQIDRLIYSRHRCRHRYYFNNQIKTCILINFVKYFLSKNHKLHFVFLFCFGFLPQNFIIISHLASTSTIVFLNIFLVIELNSNWEITIKKTRLTHLLEQNISYISSSFC